MGKWGHCWDIMEFFLIYEIHGLFCNVWNLSGTCMDEMGNKIVQGTFWNV